MDGHGHDQGHDQGQGQGYGQHGQDRDRAPQPSPQQYGLPDESQQQHQQQPQQQQPQGVFQMSPPPHQQYMLQDKPPPSPSPNASQYYSQSQAQSQSQSQAQSQSQTTQTQSQAQPQTHSMIHLRVLSAMTGQVYPISLPPNEVSVRTIRQYLSQSTVADVPLGDQILLLGPPYKVPKDVSLRNGDTLASLRLGDDEDGWSWTRHYDDIATATGISQSLTANACGASSMTTSTSTSTAVHSRARAPSFTLTSATEKTGAKRLFLFSKKALMAGTNANANLNLGHSTVTTSSASAMGGDPHQSQSLNHPPMTVVLLQPQDIELPMELPNQQEYPSSVFSSIVTTASHPHSPLHQALDVYERRFQLNVHQGKVLAHGASMRIMASDTCLSEQGVMAHALRAAVSNLSDHRSNATRAMAGFATDFHSVTCEHSKILDGFEALLHELGETPLHPSLVAIAKRSGRRMETLVDCIPLERYRSWAQQCGVSHDRLQQAFAELENDLFSQIGNAASWQQELEQDEHAENVVTLLKQRLEAEGLAIQQLQQERVAQLTASHSQVATVVMNAVSGNSQKQMVASVSAVAPTVAGDAAAGGPPPTVAPTPPVMCVQAAFATLETMSHETSAIVPSMQSDDFKLKQFMNEIGTAKSCAMQRIQQRLTSISVAQSTIQRVLTSINLLKDSLGQQHFNVESLEHVVEFSASYQAFLGEVQRRRCYNEAVQAQITSMMQLIAHMRASEIQSREDFLRVSGKHLQPPFYEMFCPTLASPPPIFAPQLPPTTIEMDSLPHITVDSVNVDVDVDVDGEVDIAEKKPAAAQAHSSISAITTTADAAEAAVPDADTTSVTGTTASLKSASTSASISINSSTSKSKHGSKDGSSEADNKDLKQEQSGGGLIIDAGAEGSGGVGMDDEHDEEAMNNFREQQAKYDAERKALLYENLLLRQSLERQAQQAATAAQQANHHPHQPHSHYHTNKPKPPPRSFVQEALEEMQLEQKMEQDKFLEANLKATVLEAKIAEMEQEMTNQKIKLGKTQSSLTKAKKKLQQQHEQQQSGVSGVGVGNAAATAMSSISAAAADTTNTSTTISDKISHSSFKVGDVGLFMPTGREKRFYLAFHSNCPHRYMSAESIPPVTSSRPEPPDYILGRIVMKEHFFANGSSGTDTNPYGLPQGTQFYVLTVEILKL
jgi:hypothetical protein